MLAFYIFKKVNGSDMHAILLSCASLGTPSGMSTLYFCREKSVTFIDMVEEYVDRPDIQVRIIAMNFH